MSTDNKPISKPMLTWPIYMSPYGVSRPQCANYIWMSFKGSLSMLVWFGEHELRIFGVVQNNHFKLVTARATVASLNSLRPRRNRRHFADHIFQCIFLNENERISLRFSLTFVPKFRINNIPSLVQIMAWCRPGDKPLSEPMMVSLLTHICVTQPQWVKRVLTGIIYLGRFCAIC